MSRNFIFNARKQGGSARNLNLRCSSDAYERDFGAYGDPSVRNHGHLSGARCDDLSTRIDGFLRGIGRCDMDARGRELLRSSGCIDVGAGGHRLLRDTKCYDFVACIDRLFRDIGCCNLSASEYSLSQDAWHRGFITPKYELRSRANCDYIVSVLLNGVVRWVFAARNSAKFSSDMYRSARADLRRVGTSQDTRSRRDSGASVSLRCSSNASDRLQRVSDRPARAACLHCRFGANPDARLRCGFGADYFKNSGGISTRNFKIYALDFARNFKISASNFTRNFKNSARNSDAEPAQSFKNPNFAHDFLQSAKSYDQNSTHGFSQNGRSADPNSALSFSQSVKNYERNLPLSFLQSAKNSYQGQNSKHASAQSHAEPNSVQNFSQSSKNSDRNFKTNSTQNGTEPVSPQELKNSEPCPAQRLGFYAPKFKDERARNFFSHPMRAFVLCACFFAALGALSFLAPDALAIDYVGAHKFYFLFLAPSCIYAAFLLTALPDWTNFEGSLKPVSLAFAACLIAAFVASFLNLRLAAAITALFWAIFFIFAAWLLWLDKNSNNFSILAVLAAFCACSAAYGANGNEKFLLSFVHINVAAIAVVSYRISVVIGNEALREGGLKDAVFIPNFIYKNLAAFLAFALALATPFLSEATCGFIALGIGFLFLAKLRELHYAEILSRHYMAFYYALQAACAAGYAWLGWELIRGGYAAAPLHVIAICYMYGAILFVGMIAGQRHSGISPLNFPRLSRAALVLALLAGGLRAVFAGESFVLYVMTPAALFIAAVALYLINFVPIFLKNPFSADPD
ncbi:NnrS family protein [uncultured Campylobacter sp.]|uniref:NnrS family protein n=1 Tax=uncultured Campylobacter sp. TaxID=218934 RepID=UPI002639B84A|nr:NnrS family protein [uncultured Campylobacter sp.]